MECLYEKLIVFFVLSAFLGSKVYSKGILGKYVTWAAHRERTQFLALKSRAASCNDTVTCPPYESLQGLHNKLEQAIYHRIVTKYVVIPAMALATGLVFCANRAL